jgi:alpha-beta hydrolase superfamily lysophospholipase
MAPRIRTYRALDGARLHYRHWTPAAAEPIARIVALHGIQSHSGWYAGSSERLCAAGCELFFLDRRGSGMNDPDRGHVAHADVWLADLLQFLLELRLEERFTGRRIPLVLMAVSWGGKLATIAAARRPDLVDRLALLYPGLCAKVRATWWQQLQLSLAERLGIRDKRVPIPLQDPALFTSQPAAQDFIRHDPLALREVSVSFLLANRQLDRWLPACPAAIRRPVLLMLAGGDRIIDNGRTRAYVDRFAATDRTILEYPQACHTLEFEPDRDRIVDDLLAWMARVDTVAQPPGAGGDPAIAAPADQGAAR